MHPGSVLLFRAYNVKIYVFVEKQEKYLSVYSSYLGLCAQWLPDKRAYRELFLNSVKTIVHWDEVNTCTLMFS